MKIIPENKGIILDIYLQDSNKIINIEMQVSNNFNLPQRSRFYQATMDVENLSRGLDYKKPKDNYVIFICTFDPVQCWVDFCGRTLHARIGKHNMFAPPILACSVYPRNILFTTHSP